MQHLKVFVSWRAQEPEWIVRRSEEGSLLRVKPQNQRNQEDIDPLSQWLKGRRGGVCAIFRQREKRN
jgi:hypothetical protein